MATLKQKQVLEKIIENGGNVSKSMKEVGYTEASARNPQKVTESKGFKELCDELGLTEHFLVSALVEDIQTKPGNRKAEIELGMKAKGMLTDKREDKVDTKLEIIWGGIDEDNNSV